MYRFYLPKNDILTQNCHPYLISDLPFDPLDMYLFYKGKLHPECEFLFQKPRKNIYYHDPVWYEPRRIGHNPIETFMRNLSYSAQLSRNDYTNHSIRSTCISNLDRLGFEARHITALSGHKSEATIKEYSVKCPENKKREMCDALVSTLHPQAKKRKSTPTATVTSPPEQQPNCNTPNTLSTINEADLNSIKKETFDLLEFNNPEDDAILQKYLDENEAFLDAALQNPNEQTKQTPNITTNQPIQQTEQKQPETQNKANTPAIEHQNNAITPQPLGNVTNTFNQFQPPMPIIPRMLFSHSNVTVNYNFITK